MCMKETECKEMGAGLSQDEASQSQPQLGQAPRYSETWHVVDKPTETSTETKSKKEERVAEAGDSRFGNTRTNTAARIQSKKEERVAEAGDSRFGNTRTNTAARIQSKKEERVAEAGDSRFGNTRTNTAAEILSKKEERVAEAGDSWHGKTKIQKAAEVKFPHNYEAILREADSLIDRSSTEKLHDRLCNGVFLNKKREKYWVEKKSNGNCFILFARNLSITWAEDARFWHWPSVYETSDVSVDVAELQNVCWLEIHGKFDLTRLTPGILYEVSFIIKLRDPAYGWEVPVNLRLSLPNGIKQERKEKLVTKPREQWIEIPVGEFKTSSESAGEMEISMYEYEGGEWKRGLVVKGIAIHPKN